MRIEWRNKARKQLKKLRNLQLASGRADPVGRRGFR
jgi:hypothetical protein